jgi:glycosyltransferase involved in cell wall biosynthesis
MKRLAVVVPCYNEKDVILLTAEKLKHKVQELMDNNRIRSDSRILFVDDGSKDTTWDLIVQLHQGDPIFSGVKLSRNRGQQNALLAGLLSAAADFDVTISMDADLQDDVGVMDQMLDRYDQGMDVVYGVRKTRGKDTFFKRWSADGFYTFMQHMGVEIIPNHAEYRLMSQRAVQALGTFQEVNLFIRGLVPLVGFPSDRVYYDRDQRAAGETKYSLRKMMELALDGITSFSLRPLRLILSAGVMMMGVGILLLFAFLGVRAGGRLINPIFYLIATQVGLTGMIVACLGVVGEYVGKILMESKQRPRYFIEERLP